MSESETSQQAGQNESGDASQNQSDAPETSTNGVKAKRVVSTIDFPYNSLESCLEVARLVHEHVGRSAATPDQVAAWLKSTVTSGTFKQRMSAARMFGLIGGERGAIRITELASRCLDPSTAAQAKVESFKQVGLYSKVFDAYRGRLLPKSAGLEAEMVALGVSENQKGRARQVFEKSARDAGLFAHGADRLVEPSFNGASASAIVPEASEPEAAPPRREANAGFGGGSAVADDPLVQGLLSRMPTPDRGWPAAERARWLQTFAMNLDLIYGAAEDHASPGGRRDPHDG